MTGTVVLGINNIYTVRTTNVDLQCRIKGKVLQEEERSYNPIAVGDCVEVEQDPISHDRGVISRRLPRKNSLSRFNKYKKCPQVMAANIDLLVVVSSFSQPSFRPRFIDRLLIAAESGHVSPVICINKKDLTVAAGAATGADATASANTYMESRLRCDWYEKIGYEVFYTSVVNGSGLDKLAKRLAGKTVVFAGQSGVGKSSILNILEPGLSLKVGEISQKYGKGSHTTNFAVMVEIPGKFTLIDTPGIRELELDSIPSDQLRFYFPEFLPFQEKCQYPSCLHVLEPDCGVKNAVQTGAILQDRYDSYCHVLEDLIAREKSLYE
ncbi:MAG: ribosome small subunit-dependent GTPase A [Spirochaetaceae bacterium]|nr:MAG: ribosome small subunit-dependent GTPase A [Spirochaetaceae bacterium]